jgi:hypothetical protein
VAGQLENEGRNASGSWWDRLLKSFVAAVAQIQLSGIAKDECDARPFSKTGFCGCCGLHWVDIN